jgi:hypothetical protein
MGLLYRLTLWSCACGGGGGFGSNGFLTKAQPFLMDGHYMMNIVSAVGYPRSDSVVSLVYGSMQNMGHRYCTTIPQSVSTLLRMGNIAGRPYN